MAQKFVSRRRKRNSKFAAKSHTHESIDQAVQSFLSKGGKITKIESVKDAYRDFMSIKESPTIVDDFLLGK